jgi:Uma2 family endonuclease
MASVSSRATEEDLRTAPEDGRKRELVDGAIVVSPAGARHGLISVRISTRLAAFVGSGRHGYVLDSSTGFRLPNGNVRLPDVAYVSRERAGEEPLGEDFVEVPPDLAVEVLSPSDRPRSVLDKVGEYLQAGVRIVWVIDPSRRRAAVYRSATETREVREEDLLDGEDVLPGFACRLADVLA